MSTSVYINGRFLNQPITGVQRYARDVQLILNETSKILAPNPSSVLKQHFWEQAILPSELRKAGSPLLLNLCNTAPLWYKNQIITIHDMAVFNNSKWFHPLFSSYYRWLIPKIVQSSKHIVTVSDFSKSEIEHYLDVREEKISVIRPVFSASWKNASTSKPSGLSDRPFLLMIGAHDPRKNIDWALAVLEDWALKNQIDIVVLHRPNSSFKAQLSLKSEHIILLTNTSDSNLKWLYENTKLLIQPSRYEGFGLVPYEALSFGAKILVSDIPVHREALGNSAHYFELDDSSSLLQMVAACLNSTPNTRIQADSTKAFTASWKNLIDRFS